MVQLTFNPIPTGLGHVTFIYGLIPPMAGRNRVNKAVEPGKKSQINKRRTYVYSGL